MDAIKYKGLEHYPKGNANLATERCNLVISNLTEAMDGLVIRTNFSKEWEMNFDPINVSDKVLGATFNQLDKLGRVKSVAQWALKESPCGKYVYLYANSKLEVDTIEVVGMKGNNEVFRRKYDNSDRKDYNWWVVAVAVYLIDKIDYSTTTTTTANSNGTTTTTTTTESFGSSATGENTRSY